ncbi:ABC transporter substrate-binding protein [Peterkaempfera griseoplana]|uniref:ABC transporter substrate-binding protein n=1 Tax=Peterkaempfera griseoplana TaxID=66896 RepID=UPI0006E2F8E9|nr:sugar ABC transporter substrate-binding protein [Peterkaempfera griseoplana]
MPHRPRPPLLAAALATALIAGLGAAGCAAQADPNVLTVMDNSTDDPFHTWDQQAYSRCAAQAGMRIRQVSVPASQLTTKALRMASSHSLPDILILDGSEMPQFAAAGGLKPLEELGVSTAGVPEGIKRYGSYQGTWYAAARAVNSLGLFYNKDILAKAGITPPTTWQELRDDARKLTHGKQYGIGLSAGGAEDGVFQFLPFMWSNGGDERKLDTPQVAQALQFWKDLLADGSLSKSTVNWTQADVNDQFIAGNAAMMINGPWQVPVLDQHKDVHWGVVQIPVPRAGMKSVAPLGGVVDAVPNTGDERREKLAAKVVSCLTSAKEQVDWAVKANYVPVTPDGARQYRQQVPQLASFADQVQTARSRTQLVGDKWPTVSLALQSAFQSALTGTTSPEAALKRAQAAAWGK